MEKLRNTLFVLLACIALVSITYHYLDQPAVFWAYQHQLRQYHLLDWFTKIPEFFSGTLIIAYPYLIIRYYTTGFRYFDAAILAAANSLVISDVLHNHLKFIFGRYWPETWRDNNLSLLRNNAYGFNWLHDGTAYKSFPSGHTSAIFCVATILWIAYPRWRWLAVLMALLVMIGLMGMYYHFISDIIAGATLGYLTAYHTASMSGLITRSQYVTNS